MTEQRPLEMVVGSYLQPDWLIDRQASAKGEVPRVRSQGLRRIPDGFTE